MDKGNPTSALDAILDSDHEVEGIVVKRLTLARMSLLELVKSPFVNLEEKFNYTNIVPSAFIVCADKEQLKGYTSRNIEKLVEKAYEWADDIDPSVLTKIIGDVLNSLALIYKISPSDNGTSDSPRTTA